MASAARCRAFARHDACSLLSRSGGPSVVRRRVGPAPLSKPRLRLFSLSSAILAHAGKDLDKSTLRNISFWGHIDAGKTTLTEKVLYHANALSPPAAEDVAASTLNGTGKRSHARQLPGDVDSGSTVTDFLEAERQRGITIQSAAVGPFFWTTEALHDTQSSSSTVPTASQITLVDTPGHIDFTIEVERSLRVADGCVVLIDGVEGVESQTEGVWRIAQRYNVRSHIAFVNKLDRMGASLARSIQSIAAKGLHARPTLLQLPIMSLQASGTSSVQEATLVGLVDLTSRPLIANFFGGRAGEDAESMTLEAAVSKGRADARLAQEASKARDTLVDSVAGLDEELLEHVLALEPDAQGASANSQVDTGSLRQAIRRLATRGEILPVLCGSAQKGIGVQPVLDAITWYMPSPDQAGDYDAAIARDKVAGCVWAERGLEQRDRERLPDKTSGKEASDLGRGHKRTAISVDDSHLSALAFKVVWDKRRGPMTFVRVYSGSLTRACTLYNTATKSKERLNKMFFAYADRLVETEKLEAGQIGVLIGLRDTRTGDTLVDSRAVNAGANKTPWAKDATSLVLRRVDVPPPVFSLSLEAAGKADEGKLREALEQLIRTDPSLHIDYGDSSGQAGTGGLGSVAASSGQMVLSGMGELHLEIAKDRLMNEFGGRAHIGPVRVSYRETAERLRDERMLDERTVLEHTLDKEIMGTPLKASCRITVRTLSSDEESSGAAARFDGNVFDIDLSGTSQGLGEGKDAKSSAPDAEHAMSADLLNEDNLRNAIQSGLNAAVSRGPLSGSPLQGLYIRVSNIKSFGPQLTTSKALSMMAADALRATLRQRGVSLMEPIMDVTVRCDEEHLGKVVGDLTSAQNGTVESVEHEHDTHFGGGENDTAEHLASIYTPPPFVEGLHESSNGALASVQDGNTGRLKSTIRATVPLIRLVQYSTQLRALTRGSGTYEMAFRGFAVVGPERQREILSELGRG